MSQRLQDGRLLRRKRHDAALRAQDLYKNPFIADGRKRGDIRLSLRNIRNSISLTSRGAARIICSSSSVARR
jgi:hypothetical protein